MKDEVRYDFQLSKTVCDRLDEMAQRMTTEIVAVRDDELRLFASSWRSDAADKLAGKYQLYFGELTDVRNEIAAAAEEIRRVSRRMFFIEEAAKKIATEKGFVTE